MSSPLSSFNDPEAGSACGSKVSTGSPRGDQAVRSASMREVSRRGVPLGAAEVFQTDVVAPPNQATYWNEVYEERFARVTFNPADRAGFQAELRLGAIGAVDFACVRAPKTEVERTRDHVRLVSKRMLAFILLVRGSGEFSQSGHVSSFEAGDIVLSDNVAPSLCRYDGPVEVIVARTTEEALRPRLPQFERLCGRRLRAGAGLADTAFGMARSLSEKLNDELPYDFAPAISGQLIDVFATAYAIAFNAPTSENSVAAARAARVKSFIEAHLGDPEMTPQGAADALGISPRYLRLLMAEGGECPSAYILRRRLEECAKQLASVSSRRRTVTDIAFSWGFNSAAHFTRVFKAKYGMTPTDYRDRRLAG
jgi:AraC-like DNA-binding protein